MALAPLHKYQQGSYIASKGNQQEGLKPIKAAIHLGIGSIVDIGSNILNLDDGLREDGEKNLIKGEEEFEEDGK